MFGQSWDDPKTLATLNMAAGLLGGGNFGQALGRGLQGYSGTMADAEDRAARKEDRAARKILADMQLEEMTRKRSEEERKRQGIQQFTDMVNPTAQALSGGGGPTAANAAKLPDQKTLQYFSMLQSGLISPQDFLTATTPKDPKVKDFKEVRNPDGSVSIVGFTEDGKVINTSQTPFKAPEVRDFGGFVAGVNPITGEVMRYGDKTQTPDSRASNAVQWANHGLAKQRLDFDRQGGVDGVLGGGKLPPGYRWGPDGQAVPIPGTQQARDAADATRSRQGAIEGAQSALALIDTALKHPGRATATGLSGILAPTNYIPGTNAKDFQAIRDQIAGGAFLQAFESLKGGGAITEIEGKKAEQAIARLQTSQSDAAFEQALKDYKEVISKGLSRMSGNTQSAPATTFDPAKESRYQAWKRLQGVQ